MAIATLSQPKVIDPRQGVTLKTRLFKADVDSGKVQIVVDFRDSNGVIIHTDSVQVDAGAWISSQEGLALNAYMSQKGLTGTIA